MNLQFPTAKISMSLMNATLAICLFIPSSAHAASPTAYESQTLSYQGKSYTIKLVTVDLKDPMIRVRPVVAANGIGHVESFSSMMERSSALAGINGTFFDAYEKDDSIRYPNGLLIHSGEIMHSGDNQAFEVLADKTPRLQKVQTELKINVTHNGKTYPIRPWGVNKYYGEAETDQVVWYTTDFGKTIDFPNATKIVVRDGVITAISQDPVNVPEDGQVCLVGLSDNNKKYLLSNVHVDDRVAIEGAMAESSSGGKFALPVVDAALGAGPRLLTNGTLDIDVARDGFTDPKITTQANVRSFIGMDAAKHMVMGTISAATIADMAQVLLQLGLTDAINLDGGASSALYYNGAVVTSPGRQLSNTWVVEQMEHPQIQLEVNGKFVHEFRGYLLRETSMVPFRGILERIGATFVWNGEERALTVQYGANRLVLKPNVPIIERNGAKLPLREAPTIVDGHIYLPLRSIIESLGGKVSWDQELYRASLEIP